MVSHTGAFKIISILSLAAMLANSRGSFADGGRIERYTPDERAKNLVVWISGNTTEGAGLIFNIENSYAYGVTAKHVVFRGDLLEGLNARFLMWHDRVLRLEVRNVHLDMDLAVFEIDLRPLRLSNKEIERVIPFDLLGNVDQLGPGDSLFTVGHAAAGSWLSNKQAAYFSHFDKLDAGPVSSVEVFTFEAECPRGYSGGGVFAQDWSLVGMMIDSTPPYCRALPINSIISAIYRWKYNINLRRPAPTEDKTLMEPQRQITAAVVDFDNRTGKNFLDIGAIAHDVTSSRLFALPGVSLVTRDRMPSIQKELRLEGTVRSAEGLSRLGKLLDVDTIVTGSIIRYDVERRESHSYRTRIQVDIHRMDISLLIIDVESARVRFSKTFDVEHKKTYPRASSAPRRPTDLASDLLKRLLDLAEPELQDALIKVADGGETTEQKIAVSVTSVPGDAEVTVNGNYVGSTPLALRLNMGLHEIEIGYPGYRRWRKMVKVKPGLRVNVHLSPLPRGQIP